MLNNKQDPKTHETRSLKRRLDAAHAELVEARKIAALSRSESYEEIGDAIECVEAAFVRSALFDEYPALVKLVGGWSNRRHPYAVVIGKYMPEQPNLLKWFLKMDDGTVVVASYDDFTRLPNSKAEPDGQST